MAFYSLTGKKECRRNHMFPFMVLLLISSIILSVCTMASFQPEERVTVRRGCYLFILGLAFFTSLFCVLNHLALRTQAGHKLKKRSHLSVTDIFDINNKIVSTVQAILSCIAGWTVCRWSCSRSLLRTSHVASDAYAWFGAAYFLYDIWSMYRVYRISIPAKTSNGTIILSYLREHAIIIAHHVFIASFGFLVIVVLRGKLGDCVFGYVYLMELSTPCVCLRGVLSRMKLKSTRMYVVNGLIMLATFFLCRVAMFPYVCYLYAQEIQLPYSQAIMSLPKGCKIGILILLLPQFYWFWLMLKGATKVFCSPKPVTQPTLTKRQRRGTSNSNHNNYNHHS